MVNRLPSIYHHLYAAEFSRSEVQLLRKTLQRHNGIAELTAARREQLKADGTSDNTIERELAELARKLAG